MSVHMDAACAQQPVAVLSCNLTGSRFQLQPLAPAAKYSATAALVAMETPSAATRRDNGNGSAAGAASAADGSSGSTAAHAPARAFGWPQQLPSRLSRGSSAGGASASAGKRPADRDGSSDGAGAGIGAEAMQIRFYGSGGDQLNLGGRLAALGTPRKVEVLLSAWPLIRSAAAACAGGAAAASGADGIEQLSGSGGCAPLPPPPLGGQVALPPCALPYHVLAARLRAAEAALRRFHEAQTAAAGASTGGRAAEAGTGGAAEAGTAGSGAVQGRQAESGTSAGSPPSSGAESSDIASARAAGAAAPAGAYEYTFGDGQGGPGGSGEAEALPLGLLLERDALAGLKPQVWVRLMFV